MVFLHIFAIFILLNPIWASAQMEDLVDTEVDPNFEAACKENLQSCDLTTAPHYLQIRALACETALKANDCDVFLRENQDLAAKMRKCDAANLCHDALQSSWRNFKKGCVNGAKKVFSEYRDLLAMSWETLSELERNSRGFAGKLARETMRKNSELLHTLDSHPDLKKAWIDMNPDFKELGPDGRANLADEPAAEILIRAQTASEFHKRSTTYAKSKLRPQPEVENGNEKAGKIFYMAAYEWLKKQRLMLQCFDETASTELICYAFFQIVDPTTVVAAPVKGGSMVARAAFKGVRSARLAEKAAVPARDTVQAVSITRRTGEGRVTQGGEPRIQPLGAVESLKRLGLSEEGEQAIAALSKVESENLSRIITEMSQRQREILARSPRQLWKVIRRCR